MSDFLKFAFEILSQIVYNIAACAVAIFKLFITGWIDYVNIFFSYFSTLGIAGKILSVILMVALIAIPILIVYIIVRRIILNYKLRNETEDNATLYREIGRLNRQVLDLIEEKNKVLALKVNAMGGTKKIPYMGASALTDDVIPNVDNVTDIDQSGRIIGPGGVVVSGEAGIAANTSKAATAAVVGGGVAGGGVTVVDPLGETVNGAMQTVGVAGAGLVGVGGMPGVAGTPSEDAITNAAAAAATAAAHAKVQAEEKEKLEANRFPKLSLVDIKYADFETPSYNEEITLQEFTEGYRLFAASQMKLYYTPEIIRRFVAGMASSQLLILEGISGTGKTSLPYSFSRYLDNPATIVSVQPSYRDRTELLGYFNEFSKRFNETEFLRALYEANYRRDPSFVVLDEMNLARIEYYFAEMLSVLEMPSKDEWILDLVPTAWPGDPELLEGGKIHVSPSMWFIGTANNDDSTFTITDKVYDRAIPIEINQRADAFECELQPRCCVTADHLRYLFQKAKVEHPISEATLSKMNKLDQYLQTRFKLAFGNRIVKQMYDFIPVYVACGGTEIGGMDYIIARKVLKKFESMNVSFVRDEIKGLLEYLDKIFGKSNMQDSREYLERIQNLY